MDPELLNHKGSVSTKIEYDRLYQIAKAMPIIKHPFVLEIMSVKNNYFGILLMISVVDDSINEEQLLFLQRMVMSDVSYQHLEHYLAVLGTIIPENVFYKLDENISGKSSSGSASTFMRAMKASFEENSNETEKETRRIIAPNDGIVFFAESKKKGEVKEQEDKYLAAYVVSFFDEYNDFCKWFASKWEAKENI